MIERAITGAPCVGTRGLASFLEWRMAAELDGWDGWEARLDRLEQSVRSGCEPRRPCATVPFADYGKSGLTTLSYPVGALTFYSLYKTLGADAFDRAYRDFFQQYRERGATSQGLIAAFKRVDQASCQHRNEIAQNHREELRTWAPHSRG